MPELRQSVLFYFVNQCNLFLVQNVLHSLVYATNLHPFEMCGGSALRWTDDAIVHT